MYDILNPIVDVIASNERIAAMLVAGLAAIFLYGLLGERFLGADAGIWVRARRTVLPKLDEIGRSHGLYAESERQSWREYAGTAYVDDLDDFERHLERMGYLRNPLAAYKYAPDGRESAGSWARRFGFIDGTGRWLKMLSDQPDLVPGAGVVERVLGNLLTGLSDILALRQRHITLFVRPWGTDKVAVDILAHDEPNSLNPLTAHQHYRGSARDEDDLGGDWDHEAGVQGFRDDVEQYAGPFGWTTEGIEQEATDDD